MKPAPRAERIALLTTLLDSMWSRLCLPLSVLPTPPVLSADPAQLAKDAAASATEIAEAVAALGVTGDDQANANRAWTATLQQIARIQKLHGLPALPFQTQSLPGTSDPVSPG